MNSGKGFQQLTRRTFDFAEAVRMYESGLSLSEVGAALGKNPELIRKTLERLGVPRRTRGGGKGRCNHQFKGGVYLRSDGYRLKRGVEGKPLEHRVVAERLLGRPLRAGEVVHHINCIRTDNRPENLLVCTHQYHMQLHARMRRDPYWQEVARQAKALTVNSK